LLAANSSNNESEGKTVGWTSCAWAYSDGKKFHPCTLTGKKESSMTIDMRLIKEGERNIPDIPAR
jgi:hypothetical protein